MSSNLIAYREEYATQAAKLCKLGATDPDLAEFFECSVQTILNWRSKHTKFATALKVAKTRADERVERSLYQRATGYSHPDVHITLTNGKIIETPFTKHYPPDTAAMMFWLKNRQSDTWRDKRDFDYRGHVAVATIKLELVHSDRGAAIEGNTINQSPLLVEPPVDVQTDDEPKRVTGG